MLRLFRSAAWLCAIVCFAVGLSAAFAADRKITLLPGTDLPGFDYAVVKDTTLKACQAACDGDNLCRAFTFNEKAKWCFLKGEAGAERPFKGATSGKIAPCPSPTRSRPPAPGELPFPAQDLHRLPPRSFAADLPDHRSAAGRRRLCRSGQGRRRRPRPSQSRRRDRRPTARRWPSTPTTRPSG